MQLRICCRANINTRGDVANVRGDIKKHGAGAGNWGQIGDEVLEDRQVTIFDL